MKRSDINVIMRTADVFVKANSVGHFVMSYKKWLFVALSSKLFKSGFISPEIEITVIALRIYQRRSEIAN